MARRSTVQPSRSARQARRSVGILLGLLLASHAALPAAAEAELEGMALVDALRAGGYNLYFRHAATDWSQDDRVTQSGDWTSCDPARIRQLSDQGRRTARQVGEAMRALAIPVGRVFASPYCRAVETAEAMDLGPVETTADVMNLRVADYFGGREAIVAMARARLASPPAAGRNDVYVAHGNVARAATAVYPGEGEGLVFRPRDGDGFEFVGRLSPEMWRRLAESARDGR
ncbi:MAG: histidine phosphatase family protein [Gammaproteobacteria bacterium]|nr:histidine phosphatase family protein [Gammaproteobacteria bacterium]